MHFEELYIQLRQKENRLLADEQVKLLPNLPKSHQHAAEWKKRQDTLKRFEPYLLQHKFNSVVEIGCGNGWFANWLSSFIPQVLGQDINHTELDQAKRVFQKKGLCFSASNDLQSLLQSIEPDLVVFNASLQYFNPSDKILDQVSSNLAEGAEIHVLDSPIYASPIESKKAQKRSEAYYQQMGVPALAEHYFHYCWEHLPNWRSHYIPPGKLGRKIWPNKSIFPWVSLRKRLAGD